MCICSFSLSNYNNSNNDREFESVSSNSEFVPPLTWTSFQKATTLSLCYLVGGELCRTPELQALCRLLYISGICISLDLSRYAHDYAASILQKTTFLNKDRVQRYRDVIYNLMSGNVFESLQSPLLPSKLGVASVRHLCKWRSCWGAQCTHREHRGTPSMLHIQLGNSPNFVLLGNTLDAIQMGTPLMLYNWGTPPTPHPIYFIASGLREMGQTRTGGIDPSVRTSCDHLCISCKLVSPILPESITITLFCILFRSPANPHHILVHCGISEKSPLILFLCHY